MTGSGKTSSLQSLLQELSEKRLSGLDFLARGSLTERVISLVLGEIPLPGSGELAAGWRSLAAAFCELDTRDLRVVVLGGGTGLSNIVGGDSRRLEWPENPFAGLKERFADLHSIVCVTDDGGSTGELLKDFPFVALGDLRHVLLSSVRRDELQARYQLGEHEALRVARILHGLFNYRFISVPASPEQLVVDSGVEFSYLPDPLAGYLHDLITGLFTDPRMQVALARPQCLGNLLLAAAIYRNLPRSIVDRTRPGDRERIDAATLAGLDELSRILGAGSQSVLPATTTPAELQVLYANGVLVTSECKSGNAQRGYPVDRVLVEFSEQPRLPDQVREIIQAADIIIMAPGSLYTSIIPILQVPGMTGLIRENRNALKLLVANIWVQKGETDATRDAPERKFHVSDLIRAYDHNISGGIRDLFSHILSLDLADVSGSVLQNYAIEQKEPIYLDSRRVRQFGLEPVEAGIFSRDLLQQRRVIQHDPAAFALVVQILWGLRSSGCLAGPGTNSMLPFRRHFQAKIRGDLQGPSLRYAQIRRAVEAMSFHRRSAALDAAQPMEAEERGNLAERLVEIIWRHPDIRMDHLPFVSGVTLVETDCWKRCQQWDNVFSFYEPRDRSINIRRDQTLESDRLEMAFLVGLGQSLLGNYAQGKELDQVSYQGQTVGRVYCLRVRPEAELHSFFSGEELDVYLRLSRMYPCSEQERLYTRLVNGEEGFTPPGLLFGLLYAWYLDNRFAPNIDYKMSIMKSRLSYLIPEQVKIVGRREQLIRFLRETVFRQQLPQVHLVADEKISV